MTMKVYALGLVVLLFAICLTSIASAQTSWSRTYGGTDAEQGYSVQQTTDGGYVIAGETGLSGSVNYDVYLVKTNASGDTLWTRTYGGTGDDCGYSVQQTTDGGYIITGYTHSFGAGTPYYANVYLIKTNASGDTLWTRTYGGTSIDRSNSVQQTTDGGYIVEGYTYSFGNSFGAVYLIKTDTSGDTLWTRTYGGQYESHGNSVQQTSDGGYIIAGYTTPSDSWGVGPYDAYLIKTNASGDTLWTRTYGGQQIDGCNSVQQTTDGGYIIAGYTNSSGAGNYDVYVIKTNATGDTVWTKTYGGTIDDGGCSVKQTTDRGYVIAGFTSSFGAGNYDIYLIKTDSNGYADGIEEPLTLHPARPSRLRVRPNPFTSFARIPGNETEFFVLSDVAGRQVAICKGGRIGAGLRPGVYFMSPVGTKTGKTATTTIIKAGF